MAKLRVYALGVLRVLHGETEVILPTRKTGDLLCYLLLHRGELLERELIAERLWPDRPAGRASRCLCTTLWRLRQSIDSTDLPDESLLLADRTTLGFNEAAPYWLDVEEFEERAAAGLADTLPCTSPGRRSLECALELYRGDLLRDRYDDWCLVERERLSLLLLRVMKRLQRHCRLTGDLEAGISLGRRLLELDPLQEDVHRELMRCFQTAGQRHLALEQFRSCRELLRAELGIEPMTETSELCQAIEQGVCEQALTAPGSPGVEHLAGAICQFSQAFDHLRSAWEELEHATGELATDGGTAAGETARGASDWL
jgi:DNA-binding SARP family transcriptional activator